MKRYLLLAVVAAFGLMATANDLSPIVTENLKAQLLAECETAPNIGADWKAHCIGAADIFSVTNEYVYDGNAKTPTPTVKLAGQTLIASTNFTYSYTNNVKAGWATLIVTAKGDGLFGAQAQKFYIAPKSASGLTVDSITNQTYTGQAICPLPTVQDGTNTLTFGTDYLVSWSNNIKATTNAQVKVTGINNYRGSKTAEFTIVEE